MPEKSRLSNFRLAYSPQSPAVIRCTQKRFFSYSFFFVNDLCGLKKLKLLFSTLEPLRLFQEWLHIELKIYCFISLTKHIRYFNYDVGIDSLTSPLRHILCDSVWRSRNYWGSCDLLSNAVKHAPLGPEKTVSLQRHSSLNEIPRLLICEVADWIRSFCHFVAEAAGTAINSCQTLPVSFTESTVIVGKWLLLSFHTFSEPVLCWYLSPVILKLIIKSAAQNWRELSWAHLIAGVINELCSP